MGWMGRGGGGEGVGVGVMERVVTAGTGQDEGEKAEEEREATMETSRESFLSVSWWRAPQRASAGQAPQ